MSPTKKNSSILDTCEYGLMSSENEVQVITISEDKINFNINTEDEIIETYYPTEKV